jgi:hypothetical protein
VPASLARYYLLFTYLAHSAQAECVDIDNIDTESAYLALMCSHINADITQGRLMVLSPNGSDPVPRNVCQKHTANRKWSFSKKNQTQTKKTFHRLAVDHSICIVPTKRQFIRASPGVVLDFGYFGEIGSHIFLFGIL